MYTVSSTLSTCGMDLSIRPKETNKLRSINSHLSQKGDCQEEEDTNILHLSGMDIATLFAGQPSSLLGKTSRDDHVRWHFYRP